MDNSTKEIGQIETEAQGAFAPESLPNVAEETVFTRRFESPTHVFDFYASPIISDEDQRRQLTEDFEPEFFEVLAIVETREAGDEGGDTSDYEYITVHGPGLTFEAAMDAARGWIEDQNPEDY